MDNECKKCLLGNESYNPDEIPLMARYVPYRVAKLIGETSCCLFENKIEHIEGTIAYLDIVGFTHIVSEYVNNKRDVGELSDIFSSYYSVIIETLREFGGSVFQFAGDSLLIGFDRMSGETPAQNWKRSFAAMYRTWELSINYNEVLESANGFALQPKIGMSSGHFYQMMLGDLYRFVTPIYTGPVIREAVKSEKNCNGQEFVISAPAFALAKECGMESWFQEKNGFYKMISVPEEFVETVERPEYYDLDALFEKPRYYKRLRAFINPMILQQIKNKFEGFNGDYRDATCVMVHFEGRFTKKNDVSLEEGYNNFNAVYEMMQDKATKYGVFCNQPDISDKGLVFPVLFGVPTSLEKKEQAAVLFADEIIQLGSEKTFITSMSAGIASGTVYSGEFGASMRKDFTVVGNIINLAARLMMHAAEKKPFSFIMDENTQSQVDSEFFTKQLEPISLKGFSEKKQVYAFVSRKQITHNNDTDLCIFGRASELKQLEDAFTVSLRSVITVIPVTGEAGLGKSFLIENFTNIIAKKYPQTKIMYAYSSQYEESTLFFCWRSIVRQIIGISETADDQELLSHIRTIFEENMSEELDWLTYFMNMLGCNFPEDESLKTINAGIKLYHFFDIVTKLLLLYLDNKPAILILEDMQWSDSVSLEMLEYLYTVDTKAQLLIIPISRNAENSDLFFEKNQINPVNLLPLDDSSAVKLTEELLNLASPQPELVEKIVSASEKNPCFIETIVHNFMETGIITDDGNGKNILLQTVTNIKIPSSIQNIILARLNALLFEEQVVCKTASVIGRMFSVNDLWQILPDGISEKMFVDALERCETSNLIVREENGSSYYFKNIIIRDVVYDTILENTKRELNTTVLSYLEDMYKRNISAVAERLVYHAQEAKAYEKVFQYALMAAARAEDKYAVKDAVTHYLTAVEAFDKLEKKPDVNVNTIYLALADAYRRNNDYTDACYYYSAVYKTEKDSLLRAKAMQGAGLCYGEQGNFERAIQSFELALESLHLFVPKTPLQFQFCIFIEGVVQLLKSSFNNDSVRQYEGKKRECAETQKEILLSIGKSYYSLLNRKVLWSILTNYNRSYKIAKAASYGIVVADYAVVLLTQANLPRSKQLFDYATDIAAMQGNRMITSIVRARYAYYFLFTARPLPAVELLEKASAHFRSAGEQWELMSAQGLLGQTYFLLNNFEQAEKAYLESQVVAKELHSAMNFGWAFCSVPFMRYLRGVSSAAEAETVISDSVLLNEVLQDHMTMATCYGFLAYIAVQEKNVQNALAYAERTIEENKKNKLNVPYLRISYSYAIDAIAAVLSQLSKKEQQHYKRHAERALKSLIKHGKNFQLTSGMAAKSGAVLALASGNEKKAEFLCNKALNIFSQTDYEGFYIGVLLIADSIPANKSKHYGEKAQELMKKNNVQNERCSIFCEH